MSLYPPPTSNVPIFNPILFSNATIGISSGGIGTAGSLNYPVAQGAETWTNGTATSIVESGGISLSVLNEGILQGVGLNGDGFGWNNGTTTTTISWDALSTKVQAVSALSSAYNASTLNVNNAVAIQNGETTGPPTSFISFTAGDDNLRLNLSPDGSFNPVNFGTAGDVLHSGGASGSMYWGAGGGGSQNLQQVLDIGNTATDQSIELNKTVGSTTTSATLNDTSLTFNIIETSVFSNFTEYTNSGFDIKPPTANPRGVDIQAVVNNDYGSITFINYDPNYNISGGLYNQTIIGDNVDATNFFTNFYDSGGLLASQNSIYIDPNAISSEGGISVLKGTYVGSSSPAYTIQEKGVLQEKQLTFEGTYSSTTAGYNYKNGISIQQSTATTPPTTVDDGGLIKISTTRTLLPNPTDTMGEVKLSPFALQFAQSLYIGNGTLPFGLSMNRQLDGNGANGIYGLQSIDITNNDAVGSKSLGAKGMYIQSTGLAPIQWVYPNDYSVKGDNTTSTFNDFVSILDLPYNVSPNIWCSYYNSNDVFEFVYTKKTEPLNTFATQEVSVAQSGTAGEGIIQFISQPINNTAISQSYFNGYGFFDGDDSSLSGEILYTPWAQNYDRTPFCILTYQSPTNKQVALQITKIIGKSVDFASSAILPVGSKVQAMFSNNPANSGRYAIADGESNGTVDISGFGPFQNPVILITLYNSEANGAKHITPVMIISITPNDNFKWVSTANIVVDDEAYLFFTIYNQNQI